MRIVSYVTLLAVAVAIPVHGADAGITGLKLVLRARGANEKLVFVSKDPATPFPAIGSADDPVTGAPGGLTIDLVTPAGVGRGAGKTVGVRERRGGAG